MAVEQSAACDSLLVIGERRYKIGSIKKNDLLSLRLDAVNARNSITTAEIARKRASLNLASFLGMPTDTDIKILLPGSPSLPVVDVDKALEMMHQNSYMIKEKMQAVAESEKELDRTNKTTRFNASVNASVGFNQAADNFADSYRDPMRQDIASLSLSIPLVDWKQGRGQRNIAKNNLSIANIDAQQKIIELEQDVIITTAELSSRHQLLASAEQAVSEAMKQETGLAVANGQRTVTLAVIKQADEGMDNMKERVNELVKQFETQFPELKFDVSRNQTELLDYTISNLKQNLVLGLILIIVVAMLFMGGVRTSVVVCVCMMVSLIVTFLPFRIFGQSLNIISLSGLILVSGMMIDNALIVSENIAQWRQRGRTLRMACVEGSRELITPLLSSTLTTVAVFLPLVFLDGMAGAIFADQAFAITAGLAVSYVVGIVLLPVFYRQIMARKAERNVYSDPNRIHSVAKIYNGGFDWVFSHKIVAVAFILLSLPLCWLVFNKIEKSRMPELDYSELQARIEWNTDVNLAENRQRTESVLNRSLFL